MKIGKIELIREILQPNILNGYIYIGIARIKNKNYTGVYLKDISLLKEASVILNDIKDINFFNMETKDIYEYRQDYNGEWYEEFDRIEITGMIKKTHELDDYYIFITDKDEINDNDFIQIDHFNQAYDENEYNTTFLLNLI